jgi:hypothetical protein
MANGCPCFKDVPHRHWVFSIPKRLRIYFLYDRKLLAKLGTPDPENYGIDFFEIGLRNHQWILLKINSVF